MVENIPGDGWLFDVSKEYSGDTPEGPITYLVLAFGTNDMKIGKTVEFNNRNLQTCCPRRLMLFGWFEGMEHEKRLHRILDRWRSDILTNGGGATIEWFTMQEGCWRALLKYIDQWQVQWHRQNWYVQLRTQLRQWYKIDKQDDVWVDATIMYKMVQVGLVPKLPQKTRDLLRDFVKFYWPMMPNTVRHWMLTKPVF